MRFLLVPIMITVFCAKPCQSACECNDFPRDALQDDSTYTSVTCRSAFNLTKDVPKHARDLEFFNLTYAETDALLNDSFFGNFSKLERVSFNHCNISNLSYIRLNDFEKIKSLDLSHTKVNLKIPLDIKTLESLELSNNFLRDIVDSPFRNLSRLKMLNLSENLIETLDKTIFTGMTELLSLDLATNKLSALKSEYFIPLSSLQYLNLSNNLLQVLNEACCDSLQRLRHLDVSQNRLARVAPGSLQLPSLSHLVLAGNTALGKSRSPSVLIGLGKRLQNVDVSNIGLKQVPEAIIHSIKTLILFKNSIHYIGCGHLDSYPLLKLLDFRGNDLEIIEDDALGRLDLLSILYLSDNKLHSFPRHLPESLKMLFLENNKIESLLRGDFQGMLLLETLILSDNKIKAIQEGAFNEVENLSNLDLSRNPIKVLPTGALEGPRRLKILRLANLNVSSPAKELAFPLQTPEHLKILDLSISPGLGKQFLADTAALTASKELQELYLTCDHIKYMKWDLLTLLPQLKLLVLFNGTFNCSNWTDIQNRFYLKEQTCADINNSVQISFLNLSDSGYGTKESVTVTNAKKVDSSTKFKSNYGQLKEKNNIIWTTHFKQFHGLNFTPPYLNKVSKVPNFVKENVETWQKTVDKMHEENHNPIRGKINFENDTVIAGKIVMISESKGHPGVLVSRKCVIKYRRQDNEVNNVPNATELW
ncbi:hypothetical protein FQA39_LY06386 [Lamprigera yunnana]|nr:hypothetical protein FQA39_LY06386 [Lamprigera yunnana]